MACWWIYALSDEEKQILEDHNLDRSTGIVASWRLQFDDPKLDKPIVGLDDSCAPPSFLPITGRSAHYPVLFTQK